jgi:phosphoribosylanthranilate isomerase
MSDVRRVDGAETLMVPAIKICGLTRVEDARSAEAAGAHFGGVILAPGSPRTIAAERIESVLGGTGLRRCGVFVNQRLDDVAEAARIGSLSVLQLHGDETPEFADLLRSATGLVVWKAIRPRSGHDFLSEAERFAGSVEGLLLDGWSAEARGGTGARFPWLEVAPHRQRMPASLRLFVAGGLTADNVREAITILSPDGVDVSSGVESSPGVKDPTSIRKFADAVRGAPAQQGAS